MQFFTDEIYISIYFSPFIESYYIENDNTCI